MRKINLIKSRRVKVFMLTSLLFYFSSCICGGGGSSSKGDPDTDTNPISSDTTAPKVNLVKAVSENEISVEFSETLDKTSAEKIANYVVSSSGSSIALSSASLESNEEVLLTLENPMDYGVTYSCLIKDVSDTSGNKITALTRTFDGRGAVLAEMTNLPAGITNGTDINISVGGTDIVAYKYSIDSADWSNERTIDEAIVKSGIAEGSRLVEVIGKDSEGNWQPENSSTRYYWEVDTTPPVAVLGSLPLSITTVTAIDITVSDSYYYKYKFNSDPWSSEVQGNLAMTGLSDGSYTLSIIGRDLAGNWQSQSDATTYSWTVDTSNPVAQLTGLPASLTNIRDTNIYVSGTNILTYKYKLDGGGWSAETPVATTINKTSLSEGSHSVSVIAKNSAGTWQSDSTPTSYSWTIDITPPTASFTQVPDSPSSVIKPDIKVGGTDVVSYKYKIDGGDWSSLLSASSFIPVSDQTEGSHTILVIGADSLGNIQSEASAANLTWTVDLTAPTASFEPSSLPASLTNSQSESLEVKTNDIEYYRYKIDTESWSSDQSISSNFISLDSGVLTEGDHTIKLIGRDLAGNWQQDADAETYTWTIDITPPVVSLSNTPSTPTNINSILVSVAGTDSVKYQYRIDSGSWVEQDIADEISLSGLSESNHTLEVKGIDAANNIQTEAVSYSWIIDQTETSAELSNIPDLLTNVQTASITVGGTDVTAYKYNLDSSGYSSEISASTAIGLTSLSEGSHTISVVAKDSAGNWQDTGASTNYTWQVDITPAAAVLGNTPASVTNSQDVDIDISGTDVIAYKYNLDSSGYSSEIPASTAIDLASLSEGSHTISVIAKDSAGNWQDTGSASSVSWSIDLTAPEAPVVLDSGATSTSSGIVFSWTNGTDVDDIKIQVATDSSFTNIVYGGTGGASLGNADNYTYGANSTNGAVYYARVKAADAVGNWSSFGTASDGIKLVGSISINVKNTSNQVLNGASVDLKKSSGGTVIATLTSDASGNVVFDDVEVGENAYILDISTTGYNSATKNNISVNIGSESNQGVIYLVPEGASSGVFSGKVIDANDGAIIAGATIEVLDWTGTVIETLTSAANGTFTSSSLSPGTYSIKISYDNYFDLMVDNQTIDGDRALGQQSICEELPPYQLRVVLTWGAEPSDLDLHLVGPASDTVTGDNPEDKTFHIYYSVKSFYDGDQTYISRNDPTGSFSTSSLVQDATNGYGPEAINLFKLEDSGAIYANGQYRFTVHRYRGSSWYSSPVTMRVYDTQGLWQEIPIPSDGDDALRFWKAIEVDIQGESRSDRTIRIVNEFATLTYGSKSSMDWGEARSGVAGFLLAVARGDMEAVAVLFTFMLMVLGLLFFLNRRRYNKGISD